MSYQCLRYSVEDSVAVVSLNRPEVFNSFNRNMAEEFQALLSAVQKDDTIRALFLTGEGKAFCAGQDLEEVDPKKHPSLDLGEIVRKTYNPIIRSIRNLEKPVVCLVNGVAAGAGASLALASDIVVASEKASFIQAFCHVGLIPDSGSTFFLPRIVGLNRAKALAMLGEKISADEAERIGIVYKIYRADEAYAEGLKLAHQIAKQATKGLALTKQAFNQSLRNTLDQQLELEEELQRQAGKTEDYVEGVIAFCEKRKPQFKGR